jgi:hypothetical protein
MPCGDLGVPGGIGVLVCQCASCVHACVCVCVCMESLAKMRCHDREDDGRALTFIWDSIHALACVGCGRRGCLFCMCTEGSRQHGQHSAPLSSVCPLLRSSPLYLYACMPVVGAPDARDATIGGHHQHWRHVILKGPVVVCAAATVGALNQGQQQGVHGREGKTGEAGDRAVSVQCMSG